MRGDVWVKENSNGEKVVCIDNGKFVSETVIKPPIVRENHKYMGLNKNNAWLCGKYVVYSIIRNERKNLN